MFNDINSFDVFRMLRLQNFWITYISEMDVGITLHVGASSLKISQPLQKYIKQGKWSLQIDLALSIEYLGSYYVSPEGVSEVEELRNYLIGKT